MKVNDPALPSWPASWSTWVSNRRESLDESEAGVAVATSDWRGPVPRRGLARGRVVDTAMPGQDVAQLLDRWKAVDVADAIRGLPPAATVKALRDSNSRDVCRSCEA